MRWIGTVLTGLAAGVALGAQGLQESRTTPEKGSAKARLFLFLSPTDRDLETLPGEIRRVMAGVEKKGMCPELRPVLLLSDFRCVEQLHADEPFFNLIKELRDLYGSGFEIRLYDQEGLAWAEKLAIERTPAWALVTSDPRNERHRAHLAYGARARIEEVTSCGTR